MVVLHAETTNRKIYLYFAVLVHTSVHWACKGPYKRIRKRNFSPLTPEGLSSII